MRWKLALPLFFVFFGMLGCSIGAATRVLFMGMPDRVLPTQRKVSLTLYGGHTLNTRRGEEIARPLRLCVYFHEAEDWSPPIDLSAPCAGYGGKLLKTDQVTLLADRVAYVSESVPYQEPAWITITGDFLDSGVEGKSILKMKSPGAADSCHWVSVDRNQIVEVSNVSSGNQPACK